MVRMRMRIYHIIYGLPFHLPEIRSHDPLSGVKAPIGGSPAVNDHNFTPGETNNRRIPLPNIQESNGKLPAMID